MSLPFPKNHITAFPTDTSYGLGVRFDDFAGMKRLFVLKKRQKGQYFSLMVKNEAMLRQFTVITPHIESHFAEFGGIHSFFHEKPRTVILKPSKNLPETDFWPKNAVAFRISTISKLTEAILVPITATSANKHGQPPLFTPQDLKKTFGQAIEIFPDVLPLKKAKMSEIWDFTGAKKIKIR